MTQAKRQDEVDLYLALRQRAFECQKSEGASFGYWGGRGAAIEVVRQLGMNEKRAFYLLEKWSRKGWVDYGMWVWGGWFTPAAPDALDRGIG